MDPTQPLDQEILRLTNNTIDTFELPDGPAIYYSDIHYLIQRLALLVRRETLRNQVEGRATQEQERDYRHNRREIRQDFIKDIREADSTVTKDLVV